MEIGNNNSQNLINAFREANPELKKLSDEEILSVMAQTYDVQPDINGVSVFSDGKIQTNEVASVKGVTLEHIDSDKNADNSAQNAVEANYKDFEYAQQQAVIDQFTNDTNAGMELYHLAMDNSGAISKGWDEIKKAFNGNLASDKVYRKLVCVQTTSILLNKVKGDEKISAYDFVQTKMDELESLIGDVTEEERIQFEIVFLYEQALNAEKTIPGGSLSQIVNLLADFEPDPNSPIDPLAQYENVTKMVKDRLKESYQKYSDTNKISKSDSISGNLSPDFNEAVLAQKDSLKKQLLDFNDVFYFERGIEFKPENIEAYYKKDFEVKLRTQVDLQLRDYRQTLDAIANKSVRQARQTQVPEMPSRDYFSEMDERETKELTHIIKSLISENEYNDYGIELDENGILKSTSERIEADGSKVYFGIDKESIALKLVELVDKKIEANLDGKTLEDYNNELGETYDNAYGKFAKPVELAERFKQSQESAVETAKTVVMVGGIAISLVSGGTVAPLVAMGVATLGPVSLTALEARTDKNGVTPEEREAIKEELGMAITFLPVGMGIGSTSAKLGMKAMGSMAQKVANSSSKFAKFLPKLTRAVSEYGSDAIMSTAADAVIMGDVSLSGETFNEVMNIFTNAVSRGKMRRLHMKKTNSAQLPKPKPDLTSSEARLLGQSVDNTKTPLSNEFSAPSKINVGVENNANLAKNEVFFGLKPRHIDELGGDFNVETIVINGKTVELAGITGVNTTAATNGQNKERFINFLKTVDDVELLQKLNNQYIGSKSYAPYYHYDAVRTLYEFSKANPNIPIKKLLSNKALDFNIMSYRQMSSDQILYALNNHYTFPFSVVKKLKNAKSKQDFLQIEIDIINLPDSKQKGNLIKLFEEKYDAYAETHEIAGMRYKIYPSGGKKYGFEIVKPPREKKIFGNNSDKNINPSNLTNALQNKLYFRSDIENIYKNNPGAKRLVGALPEQWGTGAGILSAEGFEKVNSIISDFAKKDFKMHDEVSVEQLQKQLQSVLNQPVKVEFIGSGQIGHAYKITVNGKDYKLKTYSFIRSDKYAHGNYNELAAGIYAQKHAGKEYVKTYFGRFGENNDGYIVTDFLNKDNDYVYPQKSLKSCILKNLETHDHKQGENDINGKEIDFGASVRTGQSYLTHNGRKILRQLVDAIDNNSTDKMQKLINTYGSSKDFQQVKDLLSSQIDVELVNTLGGKYLQDRADVISLLGIDCLPNIAEYGVFNSYHGEKFGFDNEESYEINKVIREYINSHVLDARHSENGATKTTSSVKDSQPQSNVQAKKVASVSESKQEAKIIDGKVLLQKPDNEWFGIVHDNYHGFDGFNELNNTFDSRMNPITLENVPPQKGTKIIHIDNFKKPGGTIAVSGTLDEYIATDRLRDCAGMVVVDRKHNLQTLIHCWPDENINFNEDIISYILSHSDSKDLEISIIPGILSETADTVAFLSDMVTKYAPESGLKYCNFPDADGFKVDGHPRSDNLTNMNNEMEHRINQADKRAVVLHNGEVTCCLNTELETGNKIVNPKDRIIYAEMPADNNNVKRVKLLSAENIAQTRDMIAELPYISRFKESDVEYYNSCINDIFEAVCKNSNGDIELIHKRINNLDENICADYIIGEHSENIDVILDNVKVIKEIKENVMDVLYWNTFDMISGITKENLPKVLEASRKAKNGDVEALRYLHYVQYSRTPHYVVYGNTNVNVDTRIILKLITGRHEVDGAYFDNEISKLFTEDVDMREKKAYGKSFAGILEQHPELLDIAEKTDGMTPDEYHNYINSLIKHGKLDTKLQFRTFKPDSRTIEANTAVGAYLYMRDNGIKTTN